MSVDEISLVRCGIDDAPALAVVGAATFLEAFAGTLDGDSILLHCCNQHSPALYQRYLEQAETQAWMAVVEPGRAPVGYAMLTRPELPLEDLSEEDIELKRIYLFSRFRGQGGGNLLLKETIQAAGKAGKRRLLLGVHADNQRALGFYRKNGFEQVGVRTFQVGRTTYDDLVLGRAI